MIGVLPSTIWNRWGRLMDAMKKQKPENSVDLVHIISNAPIVNNEEVLQNRASNHSVGKHLNWEDDLDRPVRMVG